MQIYNVTQGRNTKTSLQTNKQSKPFSNLKNNQDTLSLSISNNRNSSSQKSKVAFKGKFLSELLRPLINPEYLPYLNMVKKQLRDSNQSIVEAGVLNADRLIRGRSHALCSQDHDVVILATDKALHLSDSNPEHVKIKKEFVAGLYYASKNLSNEYFLRMSSKLDNKVYGELKKELILSNIKYERVPYEELNNKILDNIDDGSDSFKKFKKEVQEKMKNKKDDDHFGSGGGSISDSDNDRVIFNAMTGMF